MAHLAITSRVIAACRKIAEPETKVSAPAAAISRCCPAYAAVDLEADVQPRRASISARASRSLPASTG
jgi:hypothetical protein